MKKLILTFMFFSAYTFISAQGIINNGANIYVAHGAYIHGGTFSNYSGGANPQIDLNGTIELEGNWYNNSSGENIFANIETVPDGNLILSGVVESKIDGNKATVFENLIIKNKEVALNTNNCEIEGQLTIDGILNLNSNKIILNNNAFDIDYKSGYILSETNPYDGLGEVEIKIGNSRNLFNIPFGSGNAENDLMITFIPESSGSPSSGSVTFAVYPASDNNEPLPEGTSGLNPFQTDKTINRFWEIAPDYNLKPDFTLSLSFNESDFPENINTDNLKLIRYNSDKQLWNDTTFDIILNGNTTTTQNISGLDFFNFWTLTEKEEIAVLNIPNGITPNNDGFNDTWVIDNLPEHTKVIIYNRWGDSVYSSDNYQNDWDGNNRPSGAYYYILTLSDGTLYHGDLNILK